MNPRKNILFIIFPAISHVNAVLSFCRLLKNQGNKVLFLGSPVISVNNYIMGQDFELIETDTLPFGLQYYEELMLYKKKNQGFKELLANRLSGQSFNKRKTELNNHLTAYDISMVFLDSFIGADFLTFYHAVNYKFIELRYITTLSPLIYKKETINTKSTVLVNYFSRFCYAWHSFFESCFLLRKTSKSLIKEKMAEHKIEKSDLLVYGRSSIIFKDIQELILSWKSLVHPLNRDNVNYIGMQVDAKRKELLATNDQSRFMDLIDRVDKIVYITFGTLYHPDQIFRIIKKLILLAPRFDKYHFLFGNISEAMVNILLTLKDSTSNNISFFGVVPQLQVLAKSSLFVTHGGFNSIKESIYFGVPLLVLPLNNTHDQSLNAEYVEKKKIGLKLSISATNIEELYESVYSLLNDSLYRQNMDNLRQDIKTDIISLNVKSFVNSINYDQELL